jgi:hypothetical protein
LFINFPLEVSWANPTVFIPVVVSSVAEANSSFTKLGEQLKGTVMPFKTVLVGSKGDWKYEKEFWELTRFYSTLQICVGCPASYTSDCPYNDFSATAKWLQRCLHEGEVRSLMDNPLMLLSYWHSKLIWTDVLHAVLWGCARDFASSAIKLLLWSRFWAGNWEQKLDLAFASFLAWCTRNGFRPSTTAFTLKSKPGVPQVNGKAFDVKLMCGWLAELLLEYSDENAALLRVTSFNLARTL